MKYSKKISVVGILISLAACAVNTSSTPPVSSRLDTSGLTVVTLGEAMVFARPTRHLTAAARDYIYLGPMEINRMGKRNHFIWVGMASTVDRTFADQSKPKATALALLVDGMPMTLPLERWRTELDRPPYKTSVPVYESLAASASLDQITRIAEAALVEVHIITATGVSAGYQKWQGQWPEWSAVNVQVKGEQ